jgi:dTDP-4-dehydrorhamnose 3,5-epimerase
VIFTETKLKGAFIIDLERRTDERGFFARVFCQQEFREFGLKAVIAQASIASNPRKGTFRGMHFSFCRRPSLSSYAARGVLSSTLS